MSSSEYDFKDPKQSEKFPRHGWAENTQGVKLLWLPIQYTIHLAKAVRDRKGATKELTPGETKNQYVFDEAVTRLAIVLREMQRIQRNAAGMAMPAQDASDWNTAEEIHYLMPCYIDLAYVYLRRLADFTTEAIRPALFENYQCAPIHFDELRDALQNRTVDIRWKPIVEISRLEVAYIKHSSWYNTLCGVSLDGKKGIRDSMEHRLSLTTTMTMRTNRQPPEILAILNAKSKDVDGETDLLAALRNVVRELCSFWTEVCYAVEFRKDYEQADLIPPFGDDGDVTGFWPPL